ncbi:MAG TPA: M1 family aminopeptidase, partial [Pseudonocardiaceae bacterium]
MAPPNLTREQARQRAALLSVEEYSIELDLTDGGGKPGEGTFSATTAVRFGCARPGEGSWIDLVAADVQSATLNGTPLDVSGYREEDGIALPDLTERNELMVAANCRYMNTGEGLHRFVDPLDGGVYLYSQFETADAKRMFACFDQPDLKARYRLTVIAPRDWKVISNAPVVDTEDASGGALRHTFARTEVLSTYLVALVAGPYAEWRDVHDGIPLGLYCRGSLAQHMDAERLFTETKQGFDFFHDAFGVRYPFGKYDQCFVPEFNFGAMENAGCVTFSERHIFRSKVTEAEREGRADTILHEMAHM